MPEVNEKYEWLKELARVLGEWAMCHGGSVEWNHDPEDRYGGYATCSRYSVPIYVDFDQERQSLEVHQLYGYRRGEEYIRRPPLWEERRQVTMEELVTTVDDFWTRAYRAHGELDKQARISKETKAKTTEASVRAQCEASPHVPGITTGKVIESAPFMQIISIYDMDSDLKVGDPVWVLAQKPVVAELDD